MLLDRELAKEFECLDLYTAPVKKAEREIVGRENEIRTLYAALMRPELCNVILLAEAGAGKTALVQGTMILDKARQYLEVDLARMIADIEDANRMAARIKKLFDETAEYVKRTNTEVVLFIDEFHQIVQLSAAAVEALKPALADSGTRGIRVIAATTYTEFRKYISSNQPLVERLQRINLAEPDKDTTVKILKGMADRYGVANQFYNDDLFELIYEYTNRYVPANAQPRKSILLLDTMVGWYRSEGRKIDKKLLADVIYITEGVNVSFRVDATTIKARLDERVFAQELATSIIEERLQICVADLNDKTKPMSSFLFTGSTGVGKTELTKQLCQILLDDDRALIRFDMTEYANNDSLDRFRQELTARVWERPYSIVLFDEVEKACAPVTRILLQVLDDGRLIDVNNRVVSFINTYIILTTNAGSEIYENIGHYNVDDSGSGSQMKKYNKLIRTSISETTGDNRFPPELLGRIDAIIPFQPLSEATMKKICIAKLGELKREVEKKHNVVLNYDSRVVRYLIEENMDTSSKSGGARAVVSKLEKEVTTAVARFINTNPNVTSIVAVVKGDMAIDNKNQLESNAYITVEPFVGNKRR
ncbi:MAG: AAA family ATPase [Ruminococcus bromii]|nr:AAA family ATPase [Ruminococcus bromii]